jgi:hypothetical protein
MEIPDYSLEQCEKELEDVRRRIYIWDRYDWDVEDYEGFLCLQHLEIALLTRLAELKKAELLRLERGREKKRLTIGKWQNEYENGKHFNKHYLSETKKWNGKLKNDKYDGLWQFDEYNYRKYRNGVMHGRYMFNHFVYTEQGVLIEKGFTWNGKDYGCSYRIVISE